MHYTLGTISDAVWQEMPIHTLAVLGGHGPEWHDGRYVESLDDLGIEGLKHGHFFSHMFI